MHTITRVVALSLTSLCCLSYEALAQTITNGDFENTTGWGASGTTSFPNGWSYLSDNTRKNAADQQTDANAIGGSGTSAFIGAENGATGSNRQEIADTFAQFTGDWFLDFDFASEDPGGAADRSLSFSTFFNTSTSIHSIRVVDLDTDGDGDVQLFNGSSWQTVTDLNNAVIFSSDVQTTPLVHHFSLAYDNTNDNFDISITRSDSSVVTATDLTIFSSAQRDVGALQFVNFNSAGDYLIDNVRLESTPVPEPSSIVLLALSGLALAVKRRRR